MRVPVTPAEAAAFCRRGGFVRLGLCQRSDEELAQVRDTFGLHEPAVEHMQNFHIRPKIELYNQDGAARHGLPVPAGPGTRRRRGPEARRSFPLAAQIIRYARDLVVAL
jgi:hypothetical protein